MSAERAITTGNWRRQQIPAHECERGGVSETHDDLLPDHRVSDNGRQVPKRTLSHRLQVVCVCAPTMPRVARVVREQLAPFHFGNRFARRRTRRARHFAGRAESANWLPQREQNRTLSVAGVKTYCLQALIGASSVSV
jgi:hypothetical protein